MKLIYKSIILPHFDYGDVVWQSANNNSLCQLKKKNQNRAGKIILKVNPYSHTSSLRVKFITTWVGTPYEKDKRSICYYLHIKS